VLRANVWLYWKAQSINTHRNFDLFSAPPAAFDDGLKPQTAAPDPATLRLLQTLDGINPDFADAAPGTRCAISN